MCHCAVPAHPLVLLHVRDDPLEKTPLQPLAWRDDVLSGTLVFTTDLYGKVRGRKWVYRSLNIV